MHQEHKEQRAQQMSVRQDLAMQWCGSKWGIPSVTSTSVLHQMHNTVSRTKLQYRRIGSMPGENSTRASLGRVKCCFGYTAKRKIPKPLLGNESHSWILINIIFREFRTLIQLLPGLRTFHCWSLQLTKIQTRASE